MHVEQDRAACTGAATYPPPSDLEEFPAPAVAPIAVMIASNRQSLHAAWVSMLACEAGIEIINEPAVDAAGLTTGVERHRTQVLLLDRALLDTLYSQSLQRIHEQHPQLRVLLLGDAPYEGVVVDVLRHRLHGFLLATCPPQAALKAIRAVNRGELWLSRAALTMAVADLLGLSNHDQSEAPSDVLRIDATEALTPRELQVVALLRRGCINKEIAQELGIMEDTVKKHLQSVFSKLGVRRRALVALRQLPAASHCIT
ncbi:LuxR C-terminal-related transcriptional regulator [Lysobacter olei]